MTEQHRNPYEPTKAPLIADGPPPGAGADDEPEYGGFWIRFGAAMLDGIFLVPLGIIQFLGVRWSANYFVYSFVPLMIFNAFYWMYLVKAFGGTPGKRVVNMRIAMADGSPVTMTAAVLRNAPIYLLSLLSSLGQLMAIRSLPESDLAGLGYLETIQLLTSSAPAWYAWVGPAIFLWLLVTAIVLLCNRRRRALHDFIAGTVVLRERR
jgi:uncharacterized RDD family membrane protein YckC